MSEIVLSTESGGLPRISTTSLQNRSGGSSGEGSSSCGWGTIGSFTQLTDVYASCQPISSATDAKSTANVMEARQCQSGRWQFLQTTVIREVGDKCHNIVHAWFGQHIVHRVNA